MLDPAVLGPVMLGLALVQGLLTIWLLTQVRRLSRAAGPPPREAMMADLANQLEPHLKQLFAEVEARQKEAAELVGLAEKLVARMKAAPASAPATAAPIEEVAETGLEARAAARQMFAAGKGLDEVAEATGLPAGELKILANLVAAKKPGQG